MRRRVILYAVPLKLAKPTLQRTIMRLPVTGKTGSAYCFFQPAAQRGTSTVIPDRASTISGSLLRESSQFSLSCNDPLSAGIMRLTFP